jgi:hypothetical protein
MGRNDSALKLFVRLECGLPSDVFEFSSLNPIGNGCALLSRAVSDNIHQQLEIAALGALDRAEKASLG